VPCLTAIASSCTGALMVLFASCLPPQLPLVPQLWLLLGCALAEWPCGHLQAAFAKSPVPDRPIRLRVFCIAHN
jgi:hypothetical protein